MNNTWFLGFDPGGDGAFGWAAAVQAGVTTLAVVATGCAAHAEEAIARAYAVLPSGVGPAAAGIDAPLFWTRTGRREVDRTVRRGMQDRGAHNVGGTVQSLNSLRGACLVQGLAAAIILRQRTPDIALTEAHPKALLWHLGVASRARAANEVSLEHLRPWISAGSIAGTEHARDAVISCIAAGSWYRRDAGWLDLAELESDRLDIVAGEVGYWMPTGSGA